jgi:hypothetical protein
VGVAGKPSAGVVDGEIEEITGVPVPLTIDVATALIFTQIGLSDAGPTPNRAPLEA